MTESELIEKVKRCRNSVTAKEILHDPGVTPNVLIAVVKRFGIELEKEVLNHSAMNADVLSEFIKKAGDQLSTDDDTWFLVFKNPYFNESHLDACYDLFLQNGYSLGDPYYWNDWIIRSNAFNEDIAIKLIDYVCENNSDKKTDVFLKIIGTKAATKNVLLLILNNTKSQKVIDALLGNSLSDKDIKLNIILKKNFLNEDDLNEFFNTAGVNAEDVGRLVRKHSTDVVIRRAMNFQAINEKLYTDIVEAIFFKQDPSDNKLLMELLKKDLPESILAIIAKKSDSVDIIQKVAEHDNAGIKVVSAIIAEVDNFNSDKHKKELLQIAKKLKERTLSKKFKVEKEENVTERLRMNVEDGMTTMLWGPSGCGKSARVFEIDPTATMLVLKNGMIPEDALGGVRADRPDEYFPPHWLVILRQKCEAEPDRQHILFIDEITNVTDHIKSYIWEIIEKRKVRGFDDMKLPDNCSIVLAGNRPEESSAVRTDSMGGVMPAPLHNRVDAMIEIKFNIDEWHKWALETNPKTGKLRMHPIVYSFCIANADKVMFTPYNPEKVEQPFLTPRKWEQLSNAVYKAEARNAFMSEQRIIEMLGDNDISHAFIEHYYREPVDMKKAENGEYTESDFPTVEDKLFALGAAIADAKGDRIAIEDFIVECLGEEYLAIYHNMKHVQDGLQETESKGRTK